MKKIIYIVLALALCLLAGCSKEPAATVTPNEQDEAMVGGYDPRFDNTVEDAAACYFSLLTEDGFGNYLMAFPTEFTEGYQKELGYDDATFQEAIDNATYTLHATRDEKYAGTDFHIEYTPVSQTEVTGEEKESIIKDLVAYCYMTRGTIEKVEKHVYDVLTYGVDPTTQEVMYEEQSNETVTMLYIHEDGWYVSPTNFQLP